MIHDATAACFRIISNLLAESWMLSRSICGNKECLCLCVAGAQDWSSLKYKGGPARWMRATCLTTPSSGCSSNAIGAPAFRPARAPVPASPARTICHPAGPKTWALSRCPSTWSRCPRSFPSPLAQTPTTITSKLSIISNPHELRA